MDTEDLNNTMNQFDHNRIYRTFYPTMAEYTFFQAHTGSVMFQTFKSPSTATV